MYCELLTFIKEQMYCIILICCTLFCTGCQGIEKPRGELDKTEYIVDIASVAGLWNISNFERFENEKLTLSTFRDIEGLLPTKYEQFLDLIFYEDGTCRQLYEVPVLALGDEYARLYCTINWSFDAKSSTITLVNNNIKAEYDTFAKTTLKILHYNDGEFILEGLQPTPYSCANTYYRLYGTIGNAKKLSEYESEYKDEKLYPKFEDPYSK